MIKSIFIGLFLIVSLTIYGQNDSILYSFFIAGHTYGSPGVNNIGLHPPFKQKFDYIKSREEIEFGVFTGDIVSPSPVLQDWQEVDVDIDSLGLPIYFAVGNHDMENRPLFESLYGNTYYSFLKNNDLFIVLDPNIDSWNISGDQLEFLKNIVIDNYLKVDNIFVFFHQILWKDQNNEYNYILWNSAAGRASNINFWNEVIPIFINLPNNVYMFAGDLGASWSTNLAYDKYKNVSFIASGMGGVDGENFVVINVQKDKSLTYDVICLSDTNINCLGNLQDHLKNNQPIDNYQINVYPNPFVDDVSFYQTKQLDTKVYFYNAYGKLVFSDITHNSYKFTFNLDFLSEGLYFVKVVNSNNEKIFKLIKN